MSVFLASPYLLVEDDLIEVIVESLNAVDYSLPSSVNTVGAHVQVPPHTPPTKPLRGAQTSETQIEVFVDALSEDGGSTIVSYSIEFFDGTNYVSLIGETTNNTDRTVIKASGLSSGVGYMFRYRALNAHGWSDYSDVETIIAGVVPTLPLNIATTNSADKFVITWDDPANIGGNLMAITDVSYQL